MVTKECPIHKIIKQLTNTNNRRRKLMSLELLHYKQYHKSLFVEDTGKCYDWGPGKIKDIVWKNNFIFYNLPGESQTAGVALTLIQAKG